MYTCHLFPDPIQLLYLFPSFIYNGVGMSATSHNVDSAHNYIQPRVSCLKMIALDEETLSLTTGTHLRTSAILQHSFWLLLFLSLFQVKSGNSGHSVSSSPYLAHSDLLFIYTGLELRNLNSIKQLLEMQVSMLILLHPVKMKMILMVASHGYPKLNFILVDWHTYSQK